MIRIANLGDLSELVGLNAIVHAIHLAERPDQFKLLRTEASLEWFRELLGRESSKIWVAETDGKLIGYLGAMTHSRPANVFCPPRTWLEIDQIAVRPENRRSGVARALLEQALAHARDQGISEVELSSWAFNHDAHRAFAKLGFRPKIVRFELRDDAAGS